MMSWYICLDITMYLYLYHIILCPWGNWLQELIQETIQVSCTKRPCIYIKPYKFSCKR